MIIVASYPGVHLLCELLEAALPGTTCRGQELPGTQLESAQFRENEFYSMFALVEGSNCVCVCVRARARARVRACVRACVRSCVCVCECG